MNHGIAPADTSGPTRQHDADAARRSLGVAGRVGLAGRTVFYLVLAGLTARIAAVGGPTGRQANTHGALAIVGGSLMGSVAIAIVAAGFVAFGAGRILGAWWDSSVSRWRRLTTALQGLSYLVLAYEPAAYLAGKHQTGSEQQQQRTARDLLTLPAGRELVAAVGGVFVVVCMYQIRTALSQDFADGLRLDEAPGWVRRAVRVAGTVGIFSRAIVFLPVGVFFVVAAVQFDPHHARGIDAELLLLSGHAWGVALLALISLGLGIFALYSGLECRYREIVAGR
ncbi:MAG: DUF1206 domain-containing protein [Acidimicrobiales bacterium]